ncbi:stonustoxin subunit beta-like isoform X2 [Brienomyrus brachyistius]|uniref:stonustoxin subunit beta-like isoform X2 n=1 Tax=Brienomyrus brachyistius TaxID=42636 RepID=UPI0020B1CC03|nr:stonustoxin subunit beta-like isoform X2 [Brienomyrus brachyistius]
MALGPDPDLLSGSFATDTSLVGAARCWRGNNRAQAKVQLGPQRVSQRGVSHSAGGSRSAADSGGYMSILGIKYSCQLMLDPNTAHSRLSLSEGNRKVTWGAEQPYPDHPERFDWWRQILCRESLTGRCYWKAEWSGDGAWIGVTYKGLGRKGDSADCGLGANDKSWMLFCSPDSYSVRHNNKQTVLPIKSSGSRRVGVYLDRAAGTLSFYRVSSDGLTLLYSFTSSFTEPLYPGFRVYHPNSPVSLCMLG